jgi:ACS family tartrate transporter-like MFS transporter
MMGGRREDLSLEQSTLRQLMRRVVPLLGIACLVQGLDQLNISFAGLQMRSALHFSAAVFGFGSGIFFVTYTTFGVPSNLLLVRFGARRWIAFLLCAFGPITAAMALTQGPLSFYMLRLMLGAAEGGFMPGVILAASLWFPELYRGRVLAWMFACNPIAATIGAPLSGWILQMNGIAGLQGWQWLFILEGLPALALGWVFLKMLPEHPGQSPWLNAAQRDWLMTTLAAERKPAARRARALGFLTDPKVLTLSGIFVCGCCLPFAVIFFLPQIINDFGFSQFASAGLAALPMACGVIAMLLWTRHSDQHGERVFHALAAQLFSLTGAIVVVIFASVSARMLGLCMVMAGVYAFLPLFWALPGSLLDEESAPGGIALINGLGGLAGFGAPVLMGILRDHTGNYSTGLIGASLLSTSAALMLLTFRRHTSPIMQSQSG